ncbi:restriction endonuclease subunit S [Pseudoalteromonas sp. ACER1]|uniref:restriction endonuclease subunit S n=1 Tax=unclassified Pseudoalteromonas TaxID=194690 RepID=UPI001F1FC4A1|nr:MULTISPECIES: restriction endonuclease subunit S [unclassified Pseudoalteromonas]MCF2846399.1 restriction endonuclease subunit S [Pseudoalteromonas sp. PAST1]MCO7209997.1 restriction endonuclease subunit S [Pseudoalteromonas sp. ACER1]
MTGRYKAYTEYKDPDIKFVSAIPSHWITTKVRHISAFGRGLAITKANLQDTGIPCVSYGEVHSTFGFEVDPKKHPLKCVSEEYLVSSPYALLSKGDFVFADTSEDIDGSGNFTQLVSNETLFAGYHTVIVRPSPDNYYRFVAYLFDSPEFRTQVRNAVKGVKVFSVTQAILKNANVWLPSFEEQQKIANFLEYETAKIDTLIAKQEKLIELLKEKRQAVISHAVTKGLNPDAPMKDSGVEWLGEVPEHWVVSQLKHHVNTVNGFGFSSNDFQDEGVPFIRAGNIKNKTIVKPDIHLPQSVVDKYQRVIMNAGELVISMVGSDPKIKASAVGQVGLVPSSLAGSVPNQNVVILREKSSLIKQFLFYVVCGTPYRYHLDVFSHKLANQSIISSSLIINAHFAFPTLEEQMQVVDFLDTQLKKYDALVEKAISSIELMKEGKTALISAAVTGKIDVRDWIASGEANNG